MREGFVIDEPRPKDEAKPAQAKRQAPPEPQSESQPEAESSPLKSEWPIVVKLRHKPIFGNKRELLEELSFREPTGSDIVRIGNPVWITTAGEIMFDERKMTLMMAQLSGVLAPLLDFLHPQDWNSCAYRLRRFFLPDPEAW